MSHIVTEQTDAVLTVRFARPEKKNALTRAMYEAICEAFQKAQGDSSVRVMLITGTPGVFTGGNDLMDFLGDPPTGENSPVFRFLRWLVTFEKPLVASVDGPAIGIGTTMLMHCDAAIVTPRAHLQMPFTKLGLVPEAASSVLLPMIVGAVRARHWLLSGCAISGEEAYRAGLASHIAAPEELEARTAQVVQELASRPPEAMRASKMLLREPMNDMVLSALVREAGIFTERLVSQEAIAAMSSFFERKK